MPYLSLFVNFTPSPHICRTPPWKAEVVEGHPNVGNAIIAGWFEAVYDPDFAIGAGGLITSVGSGASKAEKAAAKNTAAASASENDK